MWQFIRALWHGFWGRCPRCGHGKIFHSYYGVNERCSQCGVQFEGTGNQSTGGMAINIVLTIALGFAGGIWLVLRYPDSVGPGLLVMLATLVIFHIVFYRFARGMWIGLMSLTGDLEH